jgi:hypothetical protein
MVRLGLRVRKGVRVRVRVRKRVRVTVEMSKTRQDRTRLGKRQGKTKQERQDHIRITNLN